MSNVFDVVNNRIDEFVNLPENQSLKRGTGKASCLFRGSLFNSTNEQEVSNQLKSKNLDVIWLGSNPNAPDSLAAITGNSDTNLYPEFIKQVNNAHFSEVDIDNNGKVKLGWDPINTPNNRWSFYTTILKDVFGDTNILMANFIPWGSKNMNTLISKLRIYDYELLERVVHFSNKLNEYLITTTKPKLIIAPKSISENNVLNKISRIDLHIKNLKTNTSFTNKMKWENKRYFYYTIGSQRFNGKDTHILSCPHPSGIRLQAHERIEAQDSLKKDLSTLFGNKH